MTNNPEVTIYYQDHRFLVSSAQARSPWKTYRLSRIEKVSIRRDPFYIVLFLYIPCFISASILIESTAWYAITTGLMWGTVMLAYNVGILMVTSRALSELAFIGSFATIKKVRAAIELALQDHDAADAG